MTNCVDPEVLKRNKVNQYYVLKRIKYILAEVEKLTKYPGRNLNEICKQDNLPYFITTPKLVRNGTINAYLFNTIAPSRDPQTWHYREAIFNVAFDPARLKNQELIDESIDRIATMLGFQNVKEDDS